MARARNIKPSFFTNEDLAELAYEARLLFIGTWTLADREGRLEDRPKKIKMALFPADSVDVNKHLQLLHESKFILRYEVDGKRYIQVMKFLKHQNPHHKEKPSTIPPAPENLMLEWLGNGVESEAPDLFKEPKTRGSPKANRADSGFLNPDPGSLNPESPSRNPDKKPSAAARRPGNGVKEEPGRTVETWNAYSAAYEQVYQVPPVRNKSVNGKLAQFVEKLGLEEAPKVAAFYLTHRKGLYVSSRHCVDLLLRDAEGLRTEWATDRKVTDTEARQQERTAARGDQAQRLIAESERR